MLRGLEGARDLYTTKAAIDMFLLQKNIPAWCKIIKRLFVAQEICAHTFRHSVVPQAAAHFGLATLCTTLCSSAGLPIRKAVQTTRLVESDGTNAGVA